MADPAPGVTLQQLRLVVAVAERRSFTEAADAVHLSQSALSRAVTTVERQVGSALFTRTTRSVVLTPVGEELVRVAREILAAHATGMNVFTRFHHGLRGVVRVAALPSLAALVVPSLVSAMRREAPEVTVQIDDTLAHVAIDRLRDGQVDLALTVDDDVPDDLACTPLASDRFHVVHPPGHPFAGRASVTWQELADEPVIRFGPASSIRSLTDRTFTALGLRPATTFEAQNVPVIAGLVAAGLGVAAVPAMVLPLVQFAGLGHVGLVEPAVDRTFALVNHPSRPWSPAVRRFTDVVRSAHA
ncbi:MAG: LysR family transcriptional regulator, partial [Pseudonocardia sp.]